MVDLNGHEAGNGGYSQRKPSVHRVSSTRKVPWVAGAGSNLQRLLERGIAEGEESPMDWRMSLYEL
jgi:hypothetical protein